MQKTKAEIVDYVVDYFKTHPRAMNAKLGCMYQTPKGNRCAHSICLSNEGLNVVLKYDRNHCSSASDIIGEFTDNIHKEEFRGHEIEFWDSVQQFHDNFYNWIPNEDGNELSDEGIIEANRLRNWKIVD